MMIRWRPSKGDDVGFCVCVETTFLTLFLCVWSGEKSQFRQLILLRHGPMRTSRKSLKNGGFPGFLRPFLGWVKGARSAPLTRPWEDAPGPVSARPMGPPWVPKLEERTGTVDRAFFKNTHTSRELLSRWADLSEALENSDLSRSTGNWGCGKVLGIKIS